MQTKDANTANLPPGQDPAPAAPSASTKALRLRVREEDLFEQERREWQQSSESALFKEYWTEAHYYFVAHRFELKMLQINEGCYCVFCYSTRNIEFQIGLCWVRFKYPAFRGLQVNMTVCNRAVEIYDKLWYPRRDEIAELVGQPVEWAGNSESTMRHVTVFQDGHDHHNRDDWENQFAWFMGTANRLKGALIGDVPFREFVCNRMTDLEREVNRGWGGRFDSPDWVPPGLAR